MQDAVRFEIETSEAERLCTDLYRLLNFVEQFGDRDIANVWGRVSFFQALLQNSVQIDPLSKIAVLKKWKDRKSANRKRKKQKYDRERNRAKKEAKFRLAYRALGRREETVCEAAWGPDSRSA